MLSPRPSTAFLIRKIFLGSGSFGSLVRSRLTRSIERVDGGHCQKRGQQSGKEARHRSGCGTASFGSISPLALGGVFGLFLSVALPAATESAIANGDTRTLHLYNPHTNESIAATYRVNGHYDPGVLEKLNWFLRDWRRNEATHMAPRLFDAVWETYREAGATAPIHVVCGYRSPQTNAMLRRRSRAVAQHSQHMLGKAMDTTMPGMSMEKVREIAMRMQMGGVGFYGDSSFVHIDVGGVRYWPRMTYAQLSRVFPDGKTVLIPTNGKPLRGYEEARAELAESGRVTQVPPSQKGGNFFAWLFGINKGGADEHEEEAAQAVAAHPGAAQSHGVAIAAAERPQPGEEARESKSTQLASRAAEADRSSEEALPVPPPRPDDFLALADVPLPPDRPAKTPFMTAPLRGVAAAEDDSTARDPIGDLVKAERLAATGRRVASLPAIITYGATEKALKQQESRTSRTAPQVLAYAPMAQMEGLRSAVRRKTARKVEKAGWASAAARLEAPSLAKIARLENESIMSPTLTGLRRAARVETAALSQKLAAGYLARFTKVATNLPTDRFSGPAVVGLRAADRRRMMFVDGSAALKKGE